MKYIQHRVNKLAELKVLAPQLGAEIDLRSDLSKPSYIHLSHDAWSRGDSLEDWLSLYKEKNSEGTIIFNTKEDGLEEEVFRLVNQFQIDNYFFLDTAFPTLVKYVLAENAKKFCCRISSFEPENMLENFKGKIPWVWADCFQGRPLPIEVVKSVSQHFNVCLVSPELLKLPVDEIQKFIHLKPYIHSVCTKRVDLWF